MTRNRPRPPAMRREYARARALPEADLAADLAGPVRGAGSPTRSAAGLPEPNAMVARHRRRRTAGPAPARCCSRGTTSAASSSSPTTSSRKGTELAGQPVRQPGLPLVRDAAAGDRRRARSSRSTGPRPRPTSPPGRAAPSSAPGPARSRRWCRTGPRWRRRWPRRSSGSAGRAGAARRRTGAGCGCVPETVEFWQGRASRLHDRLRFRARTGTAGSWSGWPREPGAVEATDGRRRAARTAGRSTPARCAVAAYRRLCIGNGGVVLRLPVHRGRRAGADVRAHQLVALGRPARRRRPGARCWSSGCGAARSPTWSTGASCCWPARR